MKSYLTHTCYQNSRWTGESRQLAKVLEEIMAENLLNFTKDINAQIQGAEQIPNRMDPQIMPRHIIIKLLITKGKEKIFSSQRKKKKMPYL